MVAQHDGKVSCPPFLYSFVLIIFIFSAIRRTPKNADRAFMETTLDDLIRHPRSWPFRTPVDGNEVPDYYEVIKHPMGICFLGFPL